MNDPPGNRGRIQAQGGGVEESESWAAENPPTWQAGLNMLHDLKKKLHKSERKNREELFEKAEGYIRAAGKKGGMDAPVTKSFKKKNSKDVRVDIEVILGVAFVSMAILLIAIIFF